MNIKYIDDRPYMQVTIEDFPKENEKKDARLKELISVVALFLGVRSLQKKNIQAEKTLR